MKISIPRVLVLCSLLLFVPGFNKVNAYYINNTELFFDNDSQIRVKDNFHGIKFIPSQNILEIREWGKINFTSGLQYNGAAKMVLQANGNLSLGTGYNNTNTVLAIQGPNTPYGSGSATKIDFQFNSAGSAEIKAYRDTSWGTYMDFLVNSQSQGSDTPGVKMRIRSDSVTIDTLLKAKEIQVKSNVWADYVFEDGYKLMPLLDLDAFVKANKHLPNIPTAEEIKDNGLNLGDMQKLHMEKIEELTLYAINQEEKINLLEHKYYDLEKKMIALEKLLISQKNL